MRSRIYWILKTQKHFYFFFQPKMCQKCLFLFPRAHFLGATHAPTEPVHESFLKALLSLWPSSYWQTYQIVENWTAYLALGNMAVTLSIISILWFWFSTITSICICILCSSVLMYCIMFEPHFQNLFIWNILQRRIII